MFGERLRGMNETIGREKGDYVCNSRSRFRGFEGYSEHLHVKKSLVTF